MCDALACILSGARYADVLPGLVIENGRITRPFSINQGSFLGDSQRFDAVAIGKPFGNP